jgi:ATP-binding cassette subfamily B protein
MSNKKSIKTYFALKSFLSYLRSYKFRLALLFVMFVLANAALGVMPIFIGKLVGALASNPVQGHQAVIYVWILIACSSLHSALWHGSEVVYLRLINPLAYRYENLLFKRVIEKPYPYFVDKFTGKLSSYISRTAQELKGFLDNIFYNYAGQAVSIVVIAVIMSSINWQTGAIFIAGLVAMFLTGRFTIRNSAKYEKQFTDVESTKNGKLIDAVANFVNVKSFQKEHAEIASIKVEQEKTVDAAARSFAWTIFFWASMSFFVRSVTWPAVIGLNVYLFLHGQINIAELATILSTVLIFSSSIWEAIWHLSQFTLKMARMEESHIYLFGKINIVKDYVETNVNDTKPVLNMELKLNNLEFAYPDKPDTTVLKNIQLSLKKGEKLGIVGRSGSGKTTLTKLLLGYYETIGEQILLDGTPISGHELAKIISYVPQDTSLFHRSVAENIAYATDRTVTRSDIVAAAKKAHADEFIAQISDGYDALVGERGVKLSAGQRQRIAIARALLDNKPLLILDEATSALDSESEVLVQQGLEALWEHKTVIAIAHRLSTLRHMDKIIVMDKGQIVEQGSHEELLKSRGIYAKLWNHQSGGFIEE